MTIGLPTIPTTRSRTYHPPPSLRRGDTPTTRERRGDIPTTGEPRWDYPPPHQRIVSDPPILSLGSFYYGYRDVLLFRNGKEVWERVPLTRYDRLHPQLGDNVAQTDLHAIICMELYIILQSFLIPHPWMYTTHDVLVKWGVLNLRHAPDIMLFTGVHQRPNDVGGEVDIVAWGWRPLLALEVTSPSTRWNDITKKNFRESKYLQYERIGIPYYVVVDQAKRRAAGKAPPIEGYRLVGNTYRQIIPDRAGRVGIKPLGLSVGPYQDRAAWFNAQGVRLLTLQEEQQRATQAEARATQAEVRADHAKVRADHAEVRATQAEMRATQEAQARLAAEEEIRQLKAKLGILE